LKAAREAIDNGQKALIFSQVNATARYIHSQMRDKPWAKLYYLYDESAPSQEKDWVLRSFALADRGVMLCPGEISEGVNLQFASVMINVDLPWDPMKIEQRIGRIQRLGSKFEELLIVNLVLADTIEEDILKILREKLNMFESLFGTVEPIIGNLSDEDDFRKMMVDLFMGQRTQSADGREISPEEHIEEALDDAAARAEEESALNPIFAGDDDY